jgi:hypothetical protein
MHMDSGVLKNFHHLSSCQTNSPDTRESFAIAWKSAET